MSSRVNEFGQPIGAALPDWLPPPTPPRAVLAGQYCRLEPLSRECHAAALFEVLAADRNAPLWTYMPYGPFASLAEFSVWIEEKSRGEDPLFFAICRRDDGRPLGLASYLRITPRYGSIEVGHLLYSPQLQRSRAATEAMYLLMKQAFELGYRRYEWKCDALNAASRAAAQRLGLTFEGVFRQASVYKGRTRDTAWFAAIDGEWPRLRTAFERWLDPNNFSSAGQQRVRLAEFMRQACEDRLSSKTSVSESL